MDISRITQVILKKCQKNCQNVKSLQFLMLQGSFNPNITFLQTKNLLVLFKGENRKMPIKSVKMKISTEKKRFFF